MKHPVNPLHGRAGRISAILAAAIFLLAILPSCGNRREAFSAASLAPLYIPQKASGFEIRETPGGSTVLVTRNPWQGTDSTVNTLLFISRNGEEPPQGFPGQVLRKNPERIVCLSSTHIAMLDAVGEAERVKGVSGLQYVSNPTVIRNAAKVADIGYDNNFDYEALAGVRPDLVILYGINGASCLEPKLKELGIPYVYVGEHLEESPLGKAEWLVFVSELAGKREEGEKVFSALVPRYEALRELAATAPESPMVMLNTPYGDSWLIPAANSYVMQLLKDANAKPAYDKNKSDKPQPIDMEEAYLYTTKADFWINVGQYSTLEEMKKALPKYASATPVVKGNVWNTTLRETPGKGNDYWESGVVHPDLVLRDLIKIFHPGLLADEELTYYKRLD